MGFSEVVGEACKLWWFYVRAGGAVARGVRKGGMGVFLPMAA